MSDKKEYYKETVERYCHVIGKNTTFSRYTKDNQSCFECENRHECEKNGGCRHHLFHTHNKKEEG
ncbi:MAG: hypothetical protein E7600_01975 [Ruminococcaceae bacterium]|nr:hypothetical protein [Oscillospiraceae bacterium]